jgi:ER lumen protein retaining receptor
MNIFRLLADQLHLASIIILLLKLHRHRDCNGISLRTQIIYLVVFVTRWVHLCAPERATLTHRPDMPI